MKIGIANDHRAYNTKEELKSLLDDYDITDYGCFSSDMLYLFCQLNMLLLSLSLALIGNNLMS